MPSPSELFQCVTLRQLCWGLWTFVAVLTIVTTTNVDSKAAYAIAEVVTAGGGDDEGGGRGGGGRRHTMLRRPAPV